MSELVFMFDGRKFNLLAGRISASLSDPESNQAADATAGSPLSWSLELEADDLEVDGETIAPSIDIDDLPVSPTNWIQLSGQSTRWQTSNSPETDDRYGMTYVWDHVLICEAVVNIGARNGSLFEVSVVGKNEDGESFNVQAVVPFTGVGVSRSRGDTAESVVARLAQVFDVSNLALESPPSGGDDGWWLLSPTAGA